MAHYPSAHCVVVAVEATLPAPAAAAASAAAATAAAAASPEGDGVEAGVLRCFDDASFVPLPGCAFALDPHELVTSLAVASLGAPPHAAEAAAAAALRMDDGGDAPTSSSSDAGAAAPPPLLVVGTSYVLDDEEEPSRGRILVLRVTGAGSERRLRIESSREVAGGVLRVAPFAAGGKLVAAINSKVQVYAWVRGGGPGRGGAAGADSDACSLVPECGFAGHTLAL